MKKFKIDDTEVIDIDLKSYEYAKSLVQCIFPNVLNENIIYVYHDFNKIFQQTNYLFVMTNRTFYIYNSLDSIKMIKPMAIAIPNNLIRKVNILKYVQVMLEDNSILIFGKMTKKSDYIQSFISKINDYLAKNEKSNSSRLIDIKLINLFNDEFTVDTNKTQITDFKEEYMQYLRKKTKIIKEILKENREDINYNQLFHLLDNYPIDSNYLNEIGRLPSIATEYKEKELSKVISECSVEYLGGIPDVPSGKIYFLKIKQNRLTLEGLINEYDFLFNEIKSINLENVNEFKQRITLTRLVLLGPLGFFLKKGSANKKFYITIDMDDYSFAVASDERGKIESFYSQLYNQWKYYENDQSEIELIPKYILSKQKRLFIQEIALLINQLIKQKMESKKTISKNMDYITELRELKALVDDNIISEEDFHKMKSKLLGI